MKNYKILVKVLSSNWEFIVTADSKKDAMVKVGEHIEHLIIEDGYTTMAIDAKENIKSNEYSIEEYGGFVLN